MRHIIKTVLLVLMSAVFLTTCSCSNTADIASSPDIQSKPSASAASKELSDKDKIFDFVQTKFYWYKAINNYDFTCEQTKLFFEDYGAKYYECTWEIDDDGETLAVTLPFIIKNDTVYDASGYALCEYQTDFDHDGETELIYHSTWGSGEITDTYYVIEKGDEPVYGATFHLAYPIQVNSDGDLIIEAVTEDGFFIKGKLIYRETDGEKTLYIDLGDYTGKLKGEDWGAIPAE